MIRIRQVPRPLDNLPNQDGYEFIGVTRDGSLRRCKVFRGDDGLHRVRGVRYADLQGWLRLSEVKES